MRDVEFAAGEFSAIMGPSGSGKSTLMHCLAGLDDCTSGKAFIGDDDLSRLDDRALTILRRDHVGFVFQAYNLLPTLTAAQNITLPLALAGRNGRLVLDRQGDRPVGFADRLRHRPSELSGGQQQRVAVARALATAHRSSSPTNRPATWTPCSAPKCSSFRPPCSDQMGQTVVMVTHDPVAAGYAERVVFSRRRCGSSTRCDSQRRRGARPHEAAR